MTEMVPDYIRNDREKSKRSIYFRGITVILDSKKFVLVDLRRFRHVVDGDLQEGEFSE